MNRYPRLINKNGYTMLEVMVVVIIVSLAASLALVKYGDYMRRIRSQEARQILTALFGAQIQRFRDVGTYFAGTQARINAVPNPLNVTFPQPLHNFNSLTAVNGTVRCGFPTVGRVVANDNSYALHITTEGNIICTSAANVCNTALCRRLF